MFNPWKIILNGGLMVPLANRLALLFAGQLATALWALVEDTQTLLRVHDVLVCRGLASGTDTDAAEWAGCEQATQLAQWINAPSTVIEPDAIALVEGWRAEINRATLALVSGK